MSVFARLAHSVVGGRLLREIQEGSKRRRGGAFRGTSPKVSDAGGEGNIVIAASGALLDDYQKKLEKRKEFGNLEEFRGIDEPAHLGLGSKTWTGCLRIPSKPWQRAQSSGV